MKVVDLEIQEMPDKQLSEIYQTVGMKFAFLSKDNKQVYCFVKCRDFLHDIVKASISGSPVSIYEMNYNPEKHPPVHMGMMKMLVRVTSGSVEGWDTIMDHSIMLLHHYEGMVGRSRSRVVRLSKASKGHIWLFTSPKVWLSSPFLVSMYSFLIRLGAKKLSFKDNSELKAEYKKIINNKDNDSTYLASIYDKMDILMKNHEVIKNSKKIDAAYIKNIGIHEFHNNGGIVSLANFSTFSKVKNERIRALLTSSVPTDSVEAMV